PMKQFRLVLSSGAALCALAASSALAQSYTIKLGGIYIDPRATSSSLKGTLPVYQGAYLGNINVNGGTRLEVQPKGTVMFSVERVLNDRWSAELVLGVPPEHDVKLRAPNPELSAFSAEAGTPLGNAKVAGTTQKLQRNSGEVVATVKQAAPTLFFNYQLAEPGAALRPFIGVGINYTRFKATSNDVGNKLYSDGKVRIDLTDSYGLAFQTGVSYRIDRNWSINAGWATAAVKNKLTIRTDHSEQKAIYRFHPSAFSMSVGYTF
ncbi:MAG: OmpW/AlkL family protein, partial [Aquabacterium sp.]